MTDSGVLRRTNLLLLAGLPGSGKTTLAAAMAAALPNSFLVSSETIRATMNMRSLLDPAARPQLHQRLLRQILGALPSHDFIVVDASLLESYARYAIVEALDSPVRVHFIGPHAPYPVIVQRTKDKFQSRPIYDSSLFDYAIAIRHAAMLTTPVFAEEATDLYASVTTIDTTTGLTNAWAKEAGGSTGLDFLREACRRAHLCFVEAPNAPSLSLLPVTRCDLWRASSSGAVALPSPAQSYSLIHDNGTSLSGPTGYSDSLRALVGSRPLILPGIKAAITDGKAVVLVHRAEEGEWGLPTGGLELSETIERCLTRETFEETGLRVLSAELVAVHSGPAHFSRDSRGGEIQRLSFVFRVDRYDGTLGSRCDEIDDVRLFELQQVPPIPPDHALAIQQTLAVKSWFNEV